jgi:YVTN family beta-propeller protein
VATGPVPISLAYSPLAQALYVADGKAGSVTVLGGSRFDEVLTRIELKPGLGPLRLTQDGRWGLTVNPSADAVYVIDTATNQLAHTLAVKGQPYQVVFSRAFAYIRALASERVTMVNLSSLGQGKEPIMQSFAAGAVAPKVAGDLVIADSLATSETEAAAFVVNPGDNTTYFYMEGMNAPTGNYQVYGAQARAALVVDRSLKEVEPGLYTSKVKIPAAGRYDVAFLLETPRLLHCFSLEAKANPRMKHAGAKLKVQYLTTNLRVPAGEPAVVEFKLVDPVTGAARSGVAGVGVLSFRVPGTQRTEVVAEEVGEGIYRALVPTSRPGSYQVTVGVPAEQVRYGDLPPFTLVALRPRPSGQTPTQAAERQP